jgi:hypothetical protein
MMDIFRDFLWHFFEVFIDDFAVFSKWIQHLGILQKTFERCRETKLKLHPIICFLVMFFGILLGHIVSQKGIKVDIEKAEF